MQKNLPELLRRKEGEQLDFKQRINSFEKIARTICAFANTKGGLILVGIKDDRTVTGIDPEEEKYMLEHAAGDYCEPQILLNFEELEDDDGRIVLIVEVEESSVKPHRCLNKHGEWQVYVRQRDKSVPAGKQAIRRLEKGTDSEPMEPTVLSMHEQGVLQFVELHERITVKQLMILLNFSKRRAERLLLEMVDRGMLRQFEHEHEMFFA